MARGFSATRSDSCNGLHNSHKGLPMKPDGTATDDSKEPCKTVWRLPGETCERTGGSHRCARDDADHMSDHRCECGATAPRRDTHHHY